MAISTLDGYIAAAKQMVPWIKTGGRTTVATGWFSLFDVAGQPGAGTLAGSSTTAGVVPTDATTGTMPIDAFGGGATGYLTRLAVSSNVACRVRVFDLLFKCGAHAFNANTALSAQPSYSGRLPGTNYKGLEIWVEQVTAATGNQAVTVTYTNDAGTGSRSTGAVGISAAPTVGRCWQLPLQAGDAGVQKIDNVQGTVATVGTFNVLVLRPLGYARIRSANDGSVLNLMDLGMPQIYADSALYCLVAADSTAAGLPNIMLEVSNA